MFDVSCHSFVIGGRDRCVLRCAVLDFECVHSRDTLAPIYTYRPILSPHINDTAETYIGLIQKLLKMSRKKNK